MTINEYFKTNRRNRIRPDLYEEVVCADGYHVSIQASHFHYCSPRMDNAAEYETVELGFPSEPDELIYEYAEDDTDFTGTVYGYVPVEVVDMLLEKHGGIANI